MTAELDEEPLDPKVEAIRRRMMRLLMVSGGIMMVGLMTVLIAIVYKINTSNISVPRQATSGTINIPKGSQVLSTATAGDKIMVTLEMPDGKRLIRLYELDGTLITHLSFSEE